MLHEALGNDRKTFYQPMIDSYSSKKIMVIRPLKFQQNALIVPLCLPVGLIVFAGLELGKGTAGDGERNLNLIMMAAFTAMTLLFGLYVWVFSSKKITITSNMLSYSSLLNKRSMARTGIRGYRMGRNAHKIKFYNYGKNQNK